MKLTPAQPMHVIFPERRHSKRYLTLKNAAITGIALIAAFILLSIWSALRPAHSGASGTLFGSGVLSSESPSAPRDPVKVVHEGSISDHSGTDSFLVDPGTPDTATASMAASVSSTAAAEQKNFEHRESQLGKGQRITISGGTEGVQMNVATATAPAAPAQPLPKSQ